MSTIEKICKCGNKIRVKGKEISSDRPIGDIITQDFNCGVCGSKNTLRLVHRGAGIYKLPDENSSTED